MADPDHPLPNPPLADLAALAPAKGPRRPPQECGPLGIRIKADGTWLYQGSPIGRIELVKLFATVLSCDEDGTYWMTTPAEHGTVEVDDAPFVAVEMALSGPPGPEQEICLRTNLDDWITLDQEHPLRVTINPETGEPGPYVMVRKGLEAKVGRAVFYQMVEAAVPAPTQESHDETAEDVIGLWSKGLFFPLGST